MEARPKRTRGKKRRQSFGRAEEGERTTGGPEEDDGARPAPHNRRDARRARGGGIHGERGVAHFEGTHIWDAGLVTGGERSSAAPGARPLQFTSSRKRRRVRRFRFRR